MKLTCLINKTFVTGIGVLLFSSAFAQNNVTTLTTKSTFSNFELKPILLPTSSFSNFELKPILLSSSSFFTKQTEDTDMEISPWEKRIGITGAFGEGSTSMTLGFSHLYGLGSSRRFKLGYGIRLSSFFGSDRKFTAAPPDLASSDNPQSFLVESGQINAVNLGIYSDYSITENVLVGFNIDVVGFSFGAEKEGIIDLNQIGIGFPITDTATPTSFNALLVGDNDRGTLNSEFWIGYRIASNVMVRGAFSYLFTEYTTDGKYQDDNDRFRYKSVQGAVGVSYIF